MTTDSTTTTAAAAAAESFTSSPISSKTMMMLLGLGMAGTSGYAGYQWYARIPNMEDQIKDLESQVDRLEDEIDRLEIQTDRLEDLNDDLNISVTEFASLNDIFNESNSIYDGLNGDYDAALEVLRAHLNDLEVENEYYKKLNRNYNSTLQALQNNVYQLENTTETLEEQNRILDETRKELSFEIGTLQQGNNVLNATVIEVERIYSNLLDENEELRTLNNDLTSITQFLNETSDDIAQSYSTMASDLAEKIDRNDYLLVEDIHIKYEQKLTNWDCNFIDRFRIKDFAQNWDIPILDNDYNDVLEYINKQVLKGICLSISDFEAYLTNEVIQDKDRSIRVNQLIPAVRSYTNLAFNYYFPNPIDNNNNDNNNNNDDGNGLSIQAWTEIQYRCENLAEDQRFLIYPTS